MKADTLRRWGNYFMYFPLATLVYDRIWYHYHSSRRGVQARCFWVGLCLSVCLSVCMSVGTRNSNNSASIDLIFVTPEGLCMWLVPPLRWFGSISGSGLKDIINESSPLGDGTKYAINIICKEDKRALCWKHHDGKCASYRTSVCHLWLPCFPLLFDLTRH